MLHIIGLTEIKDGGKKLIQRKKEGERDAASLLENTIIQLESHDKISRLTTPSQYGDNHADRLFNVALELVITWMNRVLFLKLLEAQLISYHKGDKQFAFLSSDKIKDFDDLDKLFFRVLARKVSDRDPAINQIFGKVPYLNSSLFEPTELEHQTIFISGLEDFITLPFISSTVIKDNSGKKSAIALNTLQYLFEFLNAYDFSSEGSEEIRDDNKSLINASVLGLIFEKINGYKDGSFFTPGFITMYMCRETIRRAIIQKFNDAKNWDCQNIEQLYDKIDNRADANTIINSLKICDPAVGSGHFLVSALNEIIAIKSELKVLTDRQGKRLKEYNVTVENDELIITDDEGQLFVYNPRNTESQRIQETLFHEKQTIIENCLFGVDLNPNSVKICRLRLWIELLKNAYYIVDHNAQVQTGHALSPAMHTLSPSQSPQLETLPNIDINIKCGNSLISRYTLDADIKKALKASKWTIDAYRNAVMSYRNAKTKDEKRDLERLINTIKNDFESEVSKSDKRFLKLAKARGELFTLTNQTSLFERSKPELAKWNKEVNDLNKTITELDTEIEQIKSNRIYENAFEWRFEFPEVLNDDGDFIGFDAVIGNPPYIRQEEFTDIKNYLQTNYQTYAGTADLFIYFIERGLQICKPNGNFIYILPNKWMRAGYGAPLRKWVEQFNIQFIYDFGDLPVFDEATTYPCLWSISKGSPVGHSFKAANIDTLTYAVSLGQYINTIAFDVNQTLLQPSGWSLVNDKLQNLLEKIKSKGIPLGEYVKGQIFYGIKTGYNEAFVIDAEIKNRLIAEDPKSAEIIKPFLAGRDIKRYQKPHSDKYLIFTKRGIDIDQYPAIKNYLSSFRDKLEPKPKDFKGDNWNGRKTGSYKWYEIQDAVDYYLEFEKPKVMLPDISLSCQATFDFDKYYCVNTAYIIPDLNYSDLAILNSNLILFFYSNISQTIRGGYFRFIKQYLEQIPIIKTNDFDEVIKGLLDVENDSMLDIIKIESDINQSIYQLYDLSADEIKIIEDSLN